MTVIEKANELAEAISNCEELIAVRSAEARMSLDPEAQDIIKEFQEKQQEVYHMQMNGQELNEEQKQDVVRIEGRMSGNQSIRDFVAAQQKFEEILKSVNMIITKAIAGDSANGCSSCDPGLCDTGCPDCN